MFSVYKKQIDSESWIREIPRRLATPDDTRLERGL